MYARKQLVLLEDCFHVGRGQISTPASSIHTSTSPSSSSSTRLHVCMWMGVCHCLACLHEEYVHLCFSYLPCQQHNLSSPLSSQSDKAPATRLIAYIVSVPFVFWLDSLGTSSVILSIFSCMLITCDTVLSVLLLLDSQVSCRMSSGPLTCLPYSNLLNGEKSVLYSGKLSREKTFTDFEV